MALKYRHAQSTDLLPIDVDGNFLELDTRTSAGWENLRGQMDYAGLAAPPLRTSYKGVPLPEYSATEVTECSIAFHLPKTYVTGTALYPHGHFVSATAGVGDIVWKFTMVWANEFDALTGTPTAAQQFGTPVSAEVVYTMTAGHIDTHVVAEAATPLIVPGLAGDAVLLMRAWRDGSDPRDTYPDPVYLVMVDLYYQRQFFGTVER